MHTQGGNTDVGDCKAMLGCQWHALLNEVNATTHMTSTALMSSYACRFLVTAVTSSELKTNSSNLYLLLLKEHDCELCTVLMHVVLLTTCRPGMIFEM